MLQRKPSPASFYLGTTPLEERLLILLQSYPGLTTTELAQMTDSHIVSTSKALSSLEQEGFIERTIIGRHSNFTITDPIVYSVLELSGV